MNLFDEYLDERMKSWRFRVMYRWYYLMGRMHDKWDIWRGNYDANGNWIGRG